MCRNTTKHDFLTIVNVIFNLNIRMKQSQLEYKLVKRHVPIKITIMILVNKWQANFIL